MLTYTEQTPLPRPLADPEEEKKWGGSNHVASSESSASSPGRGAPLRLLGRRGTHDRAVGWAEGGVGAGAGAGGGGGPGEVPGADPGAGPVPGMARGAPGVHTKDGEGWGDGRARAESGCWRPHSPTTSHNDIQQAQTLKHTLTHLLRLL